MKPEPISNKQARELCQQACDMLNSAFAADPAAIHALSALRFPCNQELADHPTVVVDQIPVLKDGPYFAVGMVGVLVGIFSHLGFPCTVASKWSDETDADGRRKMEGFGVIDFNAVKYADDKDGDE